MAQLKESTSLNAIAVFAPYLHELNKGKGKNRKEFPFLNTDLENVNIWWDSLNEQQKHDVGGIAIHFNKMTANYRWNNFSNYDSLKKSQKKIIEFVFNRKDEDYTIFYLPGMLSNML